MTLNEFLSKAGSLFKDNAADISAIQTEVATKNQEIATLSTQNGELSAKLETANKEVADLKAAATKAAEYHKAELDAKEADVEKRASAKALELAAKQGVPPGVVKPDTGKSEKADFSKLTGLAKVIAIEKAESEAKKQK